MKKTRAFFSALILITGFLSSCNFTAIPNDGSNADNRLSQGYSEPAKDNGGSGGNEESFQGGNTNDKFWKDWAPFAGIQVWGLAPNEGWGKVPVIDLETGTFSCSETGVYMPLFGAYDSSGAGINGTYDLSKIKKFECDIWTEKANIKEMTIYVYNKVEKKFVPKTTSEHIEIEVTPEQAGNILFRLSWETTTTNNVLHMENIAFYDENGNQVKDISFTLEQE